MTMVPLCDEASSAAGSWSGSVPGPGLRGGGGGAAQDVAHTLLLQALQRPGPPPPIGQHGLRLQGQPGHLPAGTTAAPPGRPHKHTREGSSL